MPAVSRIRVVDTLPLQVRHNRVHLPKFNPIRNACEGWGTISVKPGWSGMWTSTYTPENPDGICDWARWCNIEGFREWQWRTGYVYEVRRGLRIIEIDSLRDLLALLDEYGLPDPISMMRPIRFFPNWERLARKFDAVHLTEQGQWDTRMTRPHSLYGWDSESTLWLRLHRNTLRYVKKVPTGMGGRRPTRQDLIDARFILHSTLHRMAEEMRQWRAMEQEVTGEPN